MRRDVLLPALLATVSQYANWATIFSFVPILAQQLNATDVTQSMLMSMHIGVVILGNLVATIVINRIDAQRLVYLNFGLLVIGLGWPQRSNYPVLMGLSIKYVADTERTIAMGLHQSVYAIGMFVGPWLSGLLADAMGIRPMFGITAFVCLALGWIGASQLIEPDVEL